MAGTIAIIGPGSELDEALARRFGREGYRVAMIGPDQARLEAILHTLRVDGIQGRAYATDTGDLAALRVTLRAVAKQFGEIDVLEYTPVVVPYDGTTGGDLDAETLLHAYQTMTLGAVAAVGGVLPAMRARGNGSIILTTGSSSVRPHPMKGATCIAGAGILNYAQTLHPALDGSGVFSASVCIGVPIVKGDERGDPDKLAKLYVELCTARNRHEMLIVPDHP